MDFWQPNTDAVCACTRCRRLRAQTHAAVRSWHVEEGEELMPDETIFGEIETDKAVDFVCSDDGFVAKILVPEDELTLLGAPILVICEEEEDIAAFAVRTAPHAPRSQSPHPTTPHITLGCLLLVTELRAGGGRTRSCCLHA